MVDLEDVVIHDPFDEIEDPPAGENPTEERSPIVTDVVTSDGVPEHEKPGNDEQPRRAVEETIGERIRLETLDCGSGMVTRAGQQVMPLEDLMKNDTVDETTEPCSQYDPRRRQATSSIPSSFYVCCSHIPDVPIASSLRSS
jgi:hypothetical protein